MFDLKNLQQYKIILASKSPRRYNLIKQMGFEIETKEIEIDETYPSDIDINSAAEYLALKKAQAVDQLPLGEKEILITSDTMVILQGKEITKPTNKEEAITYLRALSNKEHNVITGCCLQTKHKRISFNVCTRVFFKNLTMEEITYYINNYKPYDKAGAYAIQEWIGLIAIERIEGCFYNVMGLPTSALYENLKQIIKD